VPTARSAIAQGSATSAAGQPGGGVQDAVAQRFRLGPGQVAVQGDELQPGQQDAGDHGSAEPRLVDLVVARREVAEAGVLAGADDVLDAGMDAVRVSTEAHWPRQPLVVAGRLVTHRV
jgi:hypothetical protein